MERLRCSQLEVMLKCQEVSRRFLKLLWCTQLDLRMHAVFGVWCHFVREVRAEEHLKRLQCAEAAAAAHSLELAGRVATAVVSTQVVMAANTMFAVWREAVKDMRVQRERKVLVQAHARGREALMCSAKLWLDSQAEAFLGRLFGDWRAYAMSLVSQRDLQRERLEMAARSQESVRRSLTMLLSCQDGLLGQEVLAAWKDLAKSARTENELVRLRRLQLKAVTRDQESLQRSVAVLSSSQDRLLLQELFIVWRDSTKGLV